MIKDEIFLEDIEEVKKTEKTKFSIADKIKGKIDKIVSYKEKCTEVFNKKDFYIALIKLEKVVSQEVSNKGKITISILNNPRIQQLVKRIKKELIISADDLNRYNPNLSKIIKRKIEEVIGKPLNSRFDQCLGVIDGIISNETNFLIYTIKKKGIGPTKEKTKEKDNKRQINYRKLLCDIDKNIDETILKELFIYLTHLKKEDDTFNIMHLFNKVIWNHNLDTKVLIHYLQSGSCEEKIEFKRSIIQSRRLTEKELSIIFQLPYILLWNDLFSNYGNSYLLKRLFISKIKENKYSKKDKKIIKKFFVDFKNSNNAANSIMSQVFLWNIESI